MAIPGRIAAGTQSVPPPETRGASQESQIPDAKTDAGASH